MPKLVYSEEAKIHLYDIKEYINKKLKNPIAAKNVLDRIRRDILRIRQNPTIGTPLKAALPESIIIAASEETNNNYRRIVSGNYLIFYHFTDDEVTIDKVVYGRRDLSKLFLNNEEKD